MYPYKLISFCHDGNFQAEIIFSYHNTVYKLKNIIGLKDKNDSSTRFTGDSLLLSPFDEYVSLPNIQLLTKAEKVLALSWVKSAIELSQHPIIDLLIDSHRFTQIKELNKR